jgi:hypothetical protein
MSEGESVEMRQGTERLLFLADGVFAIALTLLIIDVVAAGTASDPGHPLEEHLLAEWPVFFGLRHISSEHWRDVVLPMQLLVFS